VSRLLAPRQLCSLVATVALAVALVAQASPREVQEVQLLLQASLEDHNAPCEDSPFVQQPILLQKSSIRTKTFSAERNAKEPHGKKRNATVGNEKNASVADFLPPSPFQSAPLNSVGRRAKLKELKAPSLFGLRNSIGVFVVLVPCVLISFNSLRGLDSKDDFPVNPQSGSPFPRGQADHYGPSEWWKTKTTGSFRFAVKYSTRIAVWIVLFSVPPLALPTGRKLFQEHGIDMATVVCNTLFIIGPDLGSTVYNGLVGSIGNFCASMTIHVLHVCYPGGYVGDNHTAWYLGVIVTMTYLSVYILLNVDDTVRFFALYSYCGQAMQFLNPSFARSPPKAFWLGTAINPLMLYLAGFLIALVCATLPSPYRALAKLRAHVEHNGEDTMRLLRRLVQFYAGGSLSMEVHELTSDVHTLNIELGCARKYMDFAWYECFGYGTSGKTLLTMASGLDAINNVLNQIAPLIAITTREPFNDEHKKHMRVLEGPLLACVDKIEQLSKACIQCTVSGLFSEGAEQRIRGLIAEVAAATGEAHRSLGTFGTLSLDHTGKHHFVYTMSAVAQTLIEHAEEVILHKDESGKKPTSAGTTEYLRQLLDPEHLRWALCNGLSLVTCFWMGYFGWGPGCASEAHPDASCFIKPYNANVALIVVFLLSKFVGSTVKNALNRVSAVVVANVVGQIGYVLFGWCTIAGRFMTGITIFLLVQPSMYVAYSKGEFADLGTRCAAIGAMLMLGPCSNNWLSYRSYANDYHSISDMVCGVFVMLVIDMVFGGESASVTCTRSLGEGMASFHRTYKAALMGGDAPEHKRDLLEELDTIQGKFDAAKSLNSECSAEPRFWKAAWRPGLLYEVVGCYTVLCRQLRILADVIGKEQASIDFLSSLPTFQRVRAELIASIDRTAALAAFVMRHDPAVPCQLAESLDVSKVPSFQGQGHGDTEALIKEIIAQPTFASEVRKTAATEMRLSTRLAVVIETLHTVNAQLEKSQHRLMSFKGL